MAALAGQAADIKRLQSQLDQMKERLDFISPMLPLLNFVQDYFQKVECEASVQLMRLKNADVYSRPQGTEDEVSNAQLETVKWLHFMTDVVMQLHSGKNDPYRTSRNHADGPVDAFADAAWRTSAAAEAAGRNQPAVASTSRHTAPPSTSPRDATGPPSTSPAVPSSVAAGLQQRGLLGHQGSTPEAPLQRGQFLLGDAGAAPGGSAGRSADQWQSTLLPDLASRVAAIASGPPGSQLSGKGLVNDPTPAQPSDLESTFGLEQTQSLSGLVLGRGSWATAYRQASGQRRDSLRLLCMSGIVTARELSDDLTVISEEHIDECVLIASEMLQTMPLDMWSRQPQEAKKFFEARLTALYRRKFGEQKP